MKRFLLALALLALPVQAQAPFVGTTNSWFPWSGNDKFQHFTTGIPGGMATYFLFKDTKHPILYTMAVGAAIGLYKEDADRRGKSTIFGPPGQAEWADAFNTMLGFGAGAAFDRYVVGVGIQRKALPDGRVDTVVGVSYRKTF